MKLTKRTVKKTVAIVLETIFHDNFSRVMKHCEFSTFILSKFQKKDYFKKHMKKYNDTLKKLG